MTTIDFAKAFDSVPIFLIHICLRRLGAPIKLINYIRELRKDNIQVTFDPYNFDIIEIQKEIKNNNYKYSFMAINGVGQGGDESPILWTFISDLLLDYLNEFQINKLTLEINDVKQYHYATAFADDITLFSNSYEQSQKQIQLVKEFSEFSTIQLNQNKCEFLIFYNNSKYNDKQFFIPRKLSNRIKPT